MADQESTRNGPVARVLIVDGHQGDRESLAAMLAAASFDVAAAATAREARKQLKMEPADAIIVDPALDDEDGLALVRSLVDAGGPPAFVVAAVDDDDLAERAYASGAADFACKPVVASEWLARLRRAVRKTNGRGDAAAGARLTLNREERSCTLDGRTHQLTRHERDFLACLIDAPNHFARYESLIAAVWGEDRAVETQYLRVLAAQVRRKLEAGGGKPPLIHTVVGEGLKLNF
jgi:two-component system KDP operon response regulator KdpE